MTKYQPYVWNGNKYVPVSLPIYDSQSDAIHAAMKMISEASHYNISNNIKKHHKEKSILAKAKEIDSSIYKFRK